MFKKIFIIYLMFNTFVFVKSDLLDVFMPSNFENVSKLIDSNNIDQIRIFVKPKNIQIINNLTNLLEPYINNDEFIIEIHKLFNVKNLRYINNITKTKFINNFQNTIEKNNNYNFFIVIFIVFVLTLNFIILFLVLLKFYKNCLIKNSD